MDSVQSNQQLDVGAFNWVMAISRTSLLVTLILSARTNVYTAWCWIWVYFFHTMCGANWHSFHETRLGLIIYLSRTCELMSNWGKIRSSLGHCGPWWSHFFCCPMGKLVLSEVFLWTDRLKLKILLETHFWPNDWYAIIFIQLVGSRMLKYQNHCFRLLPQLGRGTRRTWKIRERRSYEREDSEKKEHPW